MVSKKISQVVVVKRQTLFTLIAVCIPFLLLLLLEWGLRVMEYGESTPVFVDAKSVEGYKAVNPQLIRRFFPYGAATPKVSPDTYYFKYEKQANTLRIVLMGGSTAAGFPYGRFGSPAGLLTHQLRAIYPQKEFEVIPVAMASINSYALRDLVDDVVELKPDAVLIYAGHNEYLGVMGVGSAYASQGNHLTNLLFLQLKDSRLFQLLQSLYQGIFTSSASPKEAGRTTMATMAKEQNIPFESPLYQAGIGQFESNMGVVLSTLTENQIPVFIGNLVANEKDQRPFASDDAKDFSGIDAIVNNRMAIEHKLGQLDALNDTTPYSANQHFAMGKLHQQQGNKDASIEAFTQAKDYDLLRFRAPSAFNQSIVKLASDHDATLVDIEASFRQESQGPIGNALMLEHLHPTKRGYFLMADRFLHSLVASKLLPEPSYPLAKSQKLRYQQVPINAIDEGVAKHKINQLKSDYPFTNTPKKVALPSGSGALNKWIRERIQGKAWLAQQQQLLSYFQRNQQWLDAANVAALMSEAVPQQYQTAMVAAKLYLKAQQPRLAWYYAKQATLGLPEDESLHLSLAEAQYLSEDEVAAKATLEYILSFAPASERAQFYLKQLANQ